MAGATRMGAAGIAAGRARLLIARGPRAAEEVVLRRLEALAGEARAGPAVLALPVWVVVPSRSLRDHLNSALVARRGLALAGVRVVTLHGVAAEIVARAGGPQPTGAAYFPLLVQRAARREPVLRAELEALQDGYTALIGTVRDLLDAGFEASHDEALDERLAELEAGDADPTVTRARALVRVAAAVAGQMAGLGVARPPDALRRARELVTLDPEAALPARAVLVHGFAEATGVAADLIEALLRHRSAWLVLDEPPDPVRPSEADPGAAFARRLRERAEAVAPREEAGVHVAAPAVEMRRTLGADAEARAVAERVRALLDGGAHPEGIGVVARDLGPYQFGVGRHFRRLGVPFSAPGAPGFCGPDVRRLEALIELLRERDKASVDAFLAAWGGPEGGLLDLRVGLRTCGAMRVTDVAALEAEALLGEGDSLPLPLRRGFAAAEDAGDDEEEERGALARRRLLPGRALRRAVAAAAALQAHLTAWPIEAAPAAYAALTRSLIEDELRWPLDVEGARGAAAALERLEAEAPAGLDVGRDEFVALLAREVAKVGREPLGGNGGGVQVLGVVEARGRTFEHLFVLGLNRDVFPRQVVEDPLLPDRVRLALACVLPDVPIKRTGFDEERYLFAQLLSASPRVVLSWQATDNEGRTRPVSPLVERLRLARGVGEAPVVPDPLSRDSLAGTRQPRPPDELAVLAGLYGTREQFAALLPVAIAAGRPAAGAQGLAAARLAVLEEMDPNHSAAGKRRAGELGPYLGFVGARRRGDRRAALSITAVEGMAGCPWQVFLRRLLAVEPPPDALAGLPEISPLVIGQIAHRVLERIVRGAAAELPTTLEDALATAPQLVAWPGDADFDRLLVEEAIATGRAAGMALPGLHRVLAELARPFLEAAREADWSGEHGDSVPVVGVEVEGRVRVRDAAGEERTLAFKADRVDRLTVGVRLTDYKTGRPVSEAKGADARRRNFLAAVGRGDKLQAAAYAIAVRSAPAVGRYLSLRPDVAPDAREQTVDGSDAEFAAAFTDAVRRVLAAWDLGAFFPRVFETDGRRLPRRCGSCEVRQGCVQDDTFACQRLASWAAAHAGEVPAGDAPGALLGVWRLAERRRREDAGKGKR